MAQIPSYKKVYIGLKNDIRNGIYKPGDLLPTEPELEKMFSVSRTTVRKAVSLLVADGLLKVKQGHGTEVVDLTAIQRLNKITSITETLTQKGYKVTTEGMCIERIKAAQDVAAALKIAVGDEVFKIQRVQYANNSPIAIMVNYIKIDVAPDLDKFANHFTSLYSFLEKQYHIVFKDAIEHVLAITADFNESQILRVPFASPLLCSKRITQNEQGPFEYAITKLIAEKYEYSVYLTGRD